jgi:hypothetical protein
MLQAACPIAPAGPGHGCTGHRSHLGPLLLLLHTVGQQMPAHAHGGLGLLIAVLGEATTAQAANTAGGQTLEPLEASHATCRHMQCPHSLTLCSPGGDVGSLVWHRAEGA